MKPLYTVLIEKDEDMYVALCPELDIASQGLTVEESKANLKEAIELFLETAPIDEIQLRTHKELFITSLEVDVA
jgi:predicted RNase H-like HicB family nuclease